MAILNKIRQRSLILILVIALALFAFVIQGVIDNPNSFSAQQDVVATVNGKEINRLEFQQKVKNIQDRVGASQTPTQIKNSVYQQELRTILLNTEYDKIGLSVEQDEVLELLKTSMSFYPEFQDDNGVFDPERLKAFVANLKEINPNPATLTANGRPVNVNYQSWTDNEKAIANNALTQSYYNLIKAGIWTTINEAEDEYFGESKTADISYVQIPYTSIADSLVEVTTSDVKTYIKDNEKRYKVDASRDVVYVEFKEEASKEDEDAIKARLLKSLNDRTEYNTNSKTTDTIPGFRTTDNVEAFVNLNSQLAYDGSYLRKAQLPASAKEELSALDKGEFHGPYKDGGYYKLSKLIDVKRSADSVKVRHILIPYAGAQRVDPSITKTPEEAKKTADSILGVLKNNRSKFKSLLSLSSDKVSNEKDGVIEFAYNSSFAPEFKAFSFDNSKGDIDVVQTSFGYHIIEILDQSNFSDTYQIATLAEEIEPTDTTLDNVFNDMSKFEIAAKSGDFEALAKERNLTVKPITFKELDENIGALGSQREIVRWSFDETTEIGDFKNFPITGFGYIVVKLVDKQEEGLMSVEDASVSVVPILKKQKKAEMITSKISATTVSEIAKNQNVSVKSALAVTMNNTTLSGAGVEPKVVGTIFGLKEGEVSQPIEGTNGVYVVEVKKVNEAKALDNYTPIMNRLNTSLKSSVQNNVFKALEAAAEIEDNRANTVY